MQNRAASLVVPLLGLLASCSTALEPRNSGHETAQRQSIRKWAACDGRADDFQAVATAFAAASHGAFTLLIDCPVRLQMGLDNSRTLFIDDGTSVEFAGIGKFTIDNVFHPAFVIASSSDITLSNWDVEYVGGLPVNWDVGGYEQNGQLVKKSGYAQPAATFNDQTLAAWLTTHRNITFRGASPIWVGPANTSTVFYLTGDVSGLRVMGLKLHVPPQAGGDHFIPMAFSFSKNYKSNQVVTRQTALTAEYVAIPHGVTFADVDFDGTYFGWQGNVQDASFQHIRSHRYGDLQDQNGANVGGIGKWFAPPHLFYLNYSKDGDPALFNRRIKIQDVVDSGPRVGQARDQGQGDGTSGYALSLKIGGFDCQVDGYQSSRPDGFLDLLASDGLTISNVTATYDSSFLHNLYPGWRFPDSPYRNITAENIVITDLATDSVQAPIGSAMQSSNYHIVIRNVTVRLKHWSGSGAPRAVIAGDKNAVSIDYVIGSGPDGH
jgi:hypothetical protein